MSPTSIIVLLLTVVFINSMEGKGIEHFISKSDGNDENEFFSPADIPDLPVPEKDEKLHFKHHGNRLQSKMNEQNSKSATSTTTNSVTMELFYNLDILSCPYAPHPGPGETRCYHTVVYLNNQGNFHCWSALTFSGSIQPSPGPIYTLSSENYGTTPYYPRRLQYFNIQCPVVGMIQNMTSNLEPPSTINIASKPPYNYCVDYVDVFYEDTGARCQMCGDQTVFSKNCEVDFFGGILVTFRSSRLNNYKGFEMNIICHDAAEQNLPGCIQTLSAEKEKTILVQEDSNNYYSSKFLPENAEAQLMNFYTSTIKSAHTFSAERNYSMLQLAILSENSCSASLRAIGRGVSPLFPPDMVMQAKMDEFGWETA